MERLVDEFGWLRERLTNWEESVRKASRVLKALFACSRAVIRSRDENELLEEICRAVVEEAGYRMAWVGVAEHDAKKSVRPVARGGFEEGYLETANITWADTERGRGPTGIAIRTGKPAIVTNILTDPSYIPWRAEAARRGYASSIAIPLVVDEQTFGAVTIYAAEPDAFGAEEVELLIQMAEDMAHGIGMLRLRAERAQYVTELEQALQKLATAQQQLLHADALVAVGRVVAGVAHELNNPLTAVSGYAQMVLRRELDDALKAEMEVIHREAERAARIVRSLLSFSRYHEPERSYISINEALERTLELRAYELKISNIELVTELQADLPNTMADFYQMQQVFLNLVVNAEQAMTVAHGGGRLLVKTRRVGPMIEITFADDGPGIPSENLPRVFDPFFTTKESEKGTGLGLSVCQGIVEQHGGRILVESQEGKGATFTVEIPVIGGDVTASL